MLPGAVPSQRHVLVTPDGRFLYVAMASRTGGTVHVFDRATNGLVATLSSGTPPEAPATPSNPLAASPDSGFVYLPVFDHDVVLTIDARAGSPTLHQILAYTGGGRGTKGLAVTPGLLTPAGAGVSVEPAKGAAITFSNVTAAGNTTVTSSNVSGISPPPGFVISGLPVYFEVRTTATFGGPVDVCFMYNDAGLSPLAEASLRLLHEEGGVFVDRTTTLDTTAKRICGRVSSFSQFVVAIRADHTPPTIRSLAASPAVLWPPDFRMVPVSVVLSVSDDFDPAPACAIVSVASNEPASGAWAVTGPLSLLLKAERSGDGSGRVYAVTIRCTDAAGNASVGTATVLVPHDQGKR